MVSHFMLKLIQGSETRDQILYSVINGVSLWEPEKES